MRGSVSRITLAFFSAFLAVTAGYGAIFVVPAMPRSVLLWGPFTDFTIPALGLGFVAVLALVAAVALFRGDGFGAALAAVAGAAIMTFEIVEAMVVGSLLSVPPGMPAAGYVGLWLQPFYLVLGIAMMLLGARVGQERRGRRAL